MSAYREAIVLLTRPGLDPKRFVGRMLYGSPLPGQEYFPCGTLAGLHTAELSVPSIGGVSVRAHCGRVEFIADVCTDEQEAALFDFARMWTGKRGSVRKLTAAQYQARLDAEERRRTGVGE